MPQDEKVNVALPEDVRRQFAALRKRLFSVESLFAACLALSALLLSFFILFVSDRFWDTPGGMRLVLLLSAIGAAAAVGYWWGRRWLLNPRDSRALAHLVQRKYPRLGDRLLGIVELAHEKTRPAYFSPELYHAAIGQVSEESAKYDFSQAVNERPLRRQFYITGGLFILALLPVLLIPQAGWNALVRWINPLGSIPRFTLVELEGVPASRVVAHGEPFRVSGKVKYRSFWQPARVKLELAGRAPLFAKVRNRSFEFEVPGLLEDSSLRIEAGDASRDIAAQASHRPGIQKAVARIDLPEYLRHPAVEENVQGGMLNVVEGSFVSIAASSSRELRAASVTFGQQEAQPALVASNTISTPKFPVQDVSVVTFGWEDTLGLTNARPWALAIQSQQDAPPVPEIADLFRDTAILETEVLPIRILARDDFGVKEVGFDWVANITDTSTNAPARKQFQAQFEDPQARDVEKIFNFSPAILRIPPETVIEMRAFATDYLPGRGRVEGPVFRVHVLGNARHAEMVRQNLESLLVHLEEVSRLQEKIASDTREMQQFEKLDTPEATEKIEQAEESQDRNAEQLRQLAEEGMKTLREALRNPAFNEQLLTEWTQDLHQMQQLSQQQMKESSQSLQQAGKQQQQEKRAENLAEALQKQQEIIEELQKMQREVNENLDDLQALTLSQRLRQLGGNEKKIEGHIQSAIPDTVGLLPQELPARYQKANSQLSELQSETQVSSADIQAEISRFFERTQKENYGEVSKEMKERQAVEELERIESLIQQNIGMEAMQNLGAWAEQFASWADKLEPKSSGEEGGGGGGAGQGGGEKDDTALKQLMALLRIREKQLNIQNRTQLLNDYLEERRTYQDGAVLLAASQAKLNSDLTKQAVENPFALMETAYNDAVTAMTDVESLLDEPRTDEVTNNAHEKSLGVLTDLINLLNEQAKQQPGSSEGSEDQSSSEQMAFLMQMMAPQMRPGMQSGQTPGGNMSGGTTDRTGGGATGDSAGKVGDGRSVQKSSGMPQNYPTEFREALENYFRALESADPK